MILKKRVFLLVAQLRTAALVDALRAKKLTAISKCHSQAPPPLQSRVCTDKVLAALSTHFGLLLCGAASGLHPAKLRLCSGRLLPNGCCVLSSAHNSHIPQLHMSPPLVDCSSLAGMDCIRPCPCLPHPHTPSPPAPTTHAQNHILKPTTANPSLLQAWTASRASRAPKPSTPSPPRPTLPATGGAPRDWLSQG